MLDLRTFTLAEVARRSGARPRSVQLWADAGVLRSVQGTQHGGSGRHRKFLANESEIAALLVPLGNLGIPVGWLGRFSNIMRNAIFSEAIGSFASFPEDHILNQLHSETEMLGLRHFIARSRAGLGRNYLLFTNSTLNLQFKALTEASGEVTIDPEQDFPKIEGSKRARIILDGNELLYGVLG